MSAEMFKDPAFMLATADLIGLAALAYFFSEENKKLKEQMAVMQSSLGRVLTELNELKREQKVIIEKNIKVATSVNDVETAISQIPNLNQIPSLGQISELERNMQSLIDELSEKEIIAPYEQQPIRPRRGQERRPAFGSTRNGNTGNNGNTNHNNGQHNNQGNNLGAAASKSRARPTTSPAHGSGDSELDEELLNS